MVRGLKAVLQLIFHHKDLVNSGLSWDLNKDAPVNDSLVSSSDMGHSFQCDETRQAYVHEQLTRADKGSLTPDGINERDSPYVRGQNISTADTIMVSSSVEATSWPRAVETVLISPKDSVLTIPTRRTASSRDAEGGIFIS